MLGEGFLLVELSPPLIQDEFENVNLLTSQRHPYLRTSWVIAIRAGHVTEGEQGRSSHTHSCTVRRSIQLACCCPRIVRLDFGRSDRA